MDGIFIRGRRPKSKKEVKESLAAGDNVRVECTPHFGGYDGLVSEAPVGRS